MNQAQTWSSTKKIARYSGPKQLAPRNRSFLRYARYCRYCWLAQIEDEELSGSSFDGEDENDMPSDASYDSEAE